MLISSLCTSSDRTALPRMRTVASYLNVFACKKKVRTTAVFFPLTLAIAALTGTVAQ